MPNGGLGSISRGPSGGHGRPHVRHVERSGSVTCPAGQRTPSTTTSGSVVVVRTAPSPGAPAMGSGGRAGPPADRPPDACRADSPSSTVRNRTTGRSAVSDVPPDGGAAVVPTARNSWARTDGAGTRVTPAP